MKKKNFKILVIIIILILFISCIRTLVNKRQKELFLDNVKGTIYYLRQDDGIYKLYKSDANLDDEELIYSHFKKGKTRNGDYNDNISDFRYYSDSRIIEFEAMHNGEWSIFALEEGKTEPYYVKIAPKEYKTLDDFRVVNLDTDYIDLEADGIFKIYEEDGSIYKEQDGNVECIKKFRGIIKSDISGVSGYYPQGLSSNNKYLIYGTTNSFTGIGYFLGLNEYRRYIMDLETLESVEYLNVYDIQWIIE